MFGLILGFIIGYGLTRTILGGIVGALASYIFLVRASRASSQQSRGGFRGFSFGSQSLFKKQDLYFQLFFLLLGKLAKSDGTISKYEENFINNLLNNMQLFGMARNMALQYFNSASANIQSYEELANTFYETQKDNVQLRSQLLYQLAGLASADNVITNQERGFLEKVASIFHLSSSELEHMLKSFGASDDQPYHVLGLSPSATNEELRSAYKAAVKEYHPDMLKSKGLPHSMHEFAEKRFLDIQDAWEKIKKVRNIN